MRHELRKLLHTRWAVLLLLTALLANGIFFFRHCTDDSSGCSLVEVKQAFLAWRSTAAVDARLARADEMLWNTGGSWSDENTALLDEMTVLKAARSRMEAAENYGQTLKDLVEENESRISMGIFGAGDNHANRVMERNIEVYSVFLGMKLPVVFSGGVEVLMDFPLTDICLVLFAILPSLVLVTVEKTDGMLLLLRPMKKGRLSLWRWKLETALVVVFAGFLLLTLTDVALSAGLLGLGDLSRPIQSVYGCELCPIPFTVLGFLLALYGWRLLWAVTLTCLFFLLACAAKRPLEIGLGAAGAVTVSLVFQFSGSLWLQALSMTAMLFREKYLKGNLLLQAGTGLLSFRTVSLGFCIVFCLVSATLSGVAFCRSSLVFVRKSAKASGPKRLALGRHTSLFLHELHKLSVLQGAAAVLVCFALFQVADSRDVVIDRGEWERYYTTYSNVLEGPPSEEKTAFLEETEEHFETLNRESPQDPALRMQGAFETARLQYENLQEGQWYLRRTPYEARFGPEALLADLGNTVKLTFVLCLCLAGIFSMEQQTGVLVLQTASGQSRRVLMRKLLLVVLLLLLTLAMAYWPRWWILYRGYGALRLEAPAFSVDAFASLPHSWTVGAALALVHFLRMLLAAVSSGIILLVSWKSRNTVSAALIALCIVCLPFFAALLLLQGNRILP